MDSRRTPEIKRPKTAHDSMKASKGIIAKAHSGGLPPRRSFSSSNSFFN